MHQDNQDTWVVGPHTIRYFPPNQVEVALTGVMDADHVKAVNQVYDEIDRVHGHFFLLVDTRAVQGLTPEARAAFSGTPRRYPFRHIAVVVESRTLRTLISMVFRASRLLAPDRFNYPVDLVATIDEAHACIEHARAKDQDTTT